MSGAPPEWEAGAAGSVHREAAKTQRWENYRPPLVILGSIHLISLLVFLIVDYSDDGIGPFCGKMGASIQGEGFLTPCFQIFFFDLPPALLVFAYGTHWFFTTRPWSITVPDALPASPVYVPKLLICFAGLLAAAVRLVTRGSSSITTHRAPSVNDMSDVMAIASLTCIGLTFYWNYRNLHTHPAYLRVVLLDSLVGGALHIARGITDPHSVENSTAGSDNKLDIVSVMHFVSGAVYVSLAVLTCLGMKNPLLERPDSGIAVKRVKASLPPLGDVWSLLRDDRWMLLLGVLLSGCQGVLVSFALIRSADLMGGDVETREEATHQLGEFLGFSAAVAISTVVQQAIFGVAGQRAKTRMKDRMFKMILLQDAEFLHQKENDIGALSSRLNTDTERFGNAITVQMSAIIKPISIVVTGIVFLVLTNWRLTCVIVVMASILVVVSISRSVLITVKYSRWYSDAAARVSSKGLEVIKGLDTVHQYLQEKNEHTDFRQYLKTVQELGSDKEVKESAFEGLENMMIALTLGVGLWYGAVLKVDDKIKADDLISFALISASVVGALEDILKSVPEFLDSSGPALRVCELITKPVSWDFDDTNFEKDCLTPAECRGEIVFDNVKFSYPHASKSTLGPNLNLRLPAGESMALVGESGCGKSTLISLLQRQYHVKGLDGQNKEPRDDEGVVTLDGIDIRKLNREWLLQQIGIVSQSSVLFNTTIRKNVAYGRREERWIDDPAFNAEQEKRIIHALDQAACWKEFVSPVPLTDQSLPGLGLDFECGEDGCHLSGGQKQRISIARMLYKEPKLFIFDEVTSALDAQSEQKVMKTLINVARDRTSVYIAHRLNTIKHANNIMVFDRSGGIQEWARHARGRPKGAPMAHDQLMSRKGKYEEMYNGQVLAEDDIEPPAEDEKKQEVE